MNSKDIILKETSRFVEKMTSNNMLVFNEDEARFIFLRHNIKNTHLVWEQIKELKIVYPYNGRWAFDINKVEFFFNNLRWN